MTFVSSTYQIWVEDLHEVDLDEVYRTSYESYDAWDRNYFDYVKQVRDKLRGRLHTRDIRFATYKPINHSHPNYWVYEQGDLILAQPHVGRNSGDAYIRVQDRDSK
jgi:hypothetical protein